MAITDGLVSYWKLDEEAGNAADAHDANTGTVHGITQGAAGKINTSYPFNGTDSDYVEVADAANLDVTNISLQAWVYPTADGVDNIKILISYI